MRQAIISDIHGNVQALRQVLSRIDEEKCHQIICLGDSVGYGPFPNECVELVHERCQMVLAGNHDHALLGLTDTEYFNEYARRAIVLSRPLMQADVMAKLAEYPLTWQQQEAFYVHATPSEPEAWHYLLNRYDVADNWDAFSQTVCFIGHSHKPVAFSLDSRKRTALRPHVDFLLQPDSRYIINVGSVGQPRDGIPDACFVIYDDEESSVRWVRVAYDVQLTQQAMRRLELPDFLIRRLTFGH
jgi:predicted phosphodiesterase